MPRPIVLALCFFLAACSQELVTPKADITPEPEFTITAENGHNKWSQTFEPVLTVDSGAIVEAFLVEASGGHVTVDTKAEDLDAILAAGPFHAPYRACVR